MCGSRRHAPGACDFSVEVALEASPGKAKAIKVPPGLTMVDMLRPVREAVPNATVRLPRKLIDVDLTCPICMNAIDECMTITGCLHRFCADCINQCLRLSKRECPSCRAPCANKRQLIADPDFDAIIAKMFNNVSDMRDVMDVRAAEFAQSDNIRVVSEDLKERLAHQERLTAAGGRSLAEIAAAEASQAAEDDSGPQRAPGFLAENAQLRPSFFHRLQANEYPGEAESEFQEPAECTCFHVEGTGGCKADCANRKARVQCDSETCPCGDNCTNVHFRALVRGCSIKPMLRNIKLGVLNTEKKGWALKTMEDVPQGRMLEEVLGEILTCSEAAARLQTPKRRAAAKTTASNFLLTLSEAGSARLYLDMTDKASLSRFANHSATPNSELQVWRVFGERRVGLFAIRDVKKDSEITVDYGRMHVGEPGLEDHAEARGGSRKAAGIPFAEAVADVIASPPPPLPCRTKWTHRVPHPVLIGHAASLR